MGTTVYNECKCGGKKDVRAKQCRKCRDGEVPIERICNKCLQLKPVSDFRFRTRGTIARPRPHCKACEVISSKARMKDHKINNPEYFEKYRLDQKINSLKLKEDKDAIVAKFSERLVCEICKKEHSDTDIKKFCIDHCHSSGRFRGILCNKCNTALGLFGDNIEIMQNAIDYINRSKEKGPD